MVFDRQHTTGSYHRITLFLWTTETDFFARSDVDLGGEGVVGEACLVVVVVHGKHIGDGFFARSGDGGLASGDNIGGPRSPDSLASGDNIEGRRP